MQRHQYCRVDYLAPRRNCNFIRLRELIAGIKRSLRASSLRKIVKDRPFGIRSDFSPLTVSIELPDDGLDDRSSGRHVTPSNRHLRNRIPRYLGSRDFRVRPCDRAHLAPNL